VGIMAVNCYGAMLTGISAIDGFKSIKPDLKSRVAGILLVAAVIFLIALNIPESYLGSFNTFVLLMLYFLVPWTAVNLVDFYLVRKGHYAISDIFNPAGIYGRWSAAGLTAYCLGLLAMVPFMSLSFYQGPLSLALGGADIAFVIGLAVAGLVYRALTRNLDLAAEQRAIQASERTLEGAAR
ncbi:MAG: cytosine permease, partial [Pseudomonas sp.]|uniref:cytosine permease n=2 Tax=unclassified Pseudomonas TaxID=196821 RepID=UPI003D0FC68C